MGLHHTGLRVDIQISVDHESIINGKTVQRRRFGNEHQLRTFNFKSKYLRLLPFVRLKESQINAITFDLDD